MQLIRNYHQTSSSENNAQPSIATIGNFDGIHLGHQKIINFVVAQATANNLRSTLISFEPTPVEYFMGNKAPARIANFRDKFDITANLNIDCFVCLRFNQTLADMQAEQFIKSVLVDALQIKQLVVGDDFQFGKDRAGDINLLQEMSTKYGYQVHDNATVVHANQRVSSSRIRESLAAGDFELVHLLLGRPFRISGRVIHGEKKGRTIGFPTANILLKRRVSPLHGVFIVTATNGENHWNGVANIGYRPTVNGKTEQLEVHLFDCNANLYGQRLHVEPLVKLRDEQKFSSLAELKHQISLDVEKAQHYFK